MANIITHIAITPRAVPYATERYVYGSVVPDFAGMYKDRHDPQFNLRSIPLNAEIKEGVEFHATTDEAFDGLPETRWLFSSLADDLRAEDGLSRGAIKALSEVGTDILIDGETMKDPAVQEYYERIRRSVLAGKFAIHAAQLYRPIDTLAYEYFKGGLPTGYQDPECVAEILHSRLARRKTGALGFEASRLDFVSYAFERQIERIAQTARLIVDKTVEKVRVFDPDDFASAV